MAPSKFPTVKNSTLEVLGSNTEMLGNGGGFNGWRLPLKCMYQKIKKF